MVKQVKNGPKKGGKLATSRVVIPQKLSGQTKTIRFCDTVGDDEDDHHYCVPPPHHLDNIKFWH